MRLMSALEDEARVRALHTSGLLTKSVQDRICHLAYTAAQLTRADIAQVNALDDNLQYHACQWPPEHSPVIERPLDASGCKEVVLSEKTIVIPDTRDHPVTCDMPWARAYPAYLGTPIRFRNEIIGSLCVLAGEPRLWSFQDVMAIEGVSHMLMLALE